VHSYHFIPLMIDQDHPSSGCAAIARIELSRLFF
jgi:hypothetical protein